MALSRTAQFYRDNPEARKKRQEYQNKYNKKRSAVKKRVEDNKKNRQFGTYGNGDKKDVSHKGKRVVLEAQSKNRASKSNTPGDKRARGKKGKGRSNKGNTGGK
jgi:hypothetical protein